MTSLGTRKGGARAIDWQEIHRRMAASAAALEAIARPDRAAARRILRQRAALLARPPVAQQEAAETIEFLEFSLASERYGFETCQIREVAPLVTLTAVPCVPPFVLGITNLRGHAVALIDLKKFFELPEQGLSNRNRIIVLGNDGVTLGILADAIVGVRACARAGLTPSLPTLSGIREDYLKGIGPGRVVILDAARVLADERIVVHEEVRG